MMDSPEFWIAATFAAVAVGLSKGGLPMVGMLGVPIMALVIPPVLAAALLAPVFVVSDIFGVYAYRRAFDARVIAIVVAGAIIGIGVGWAAADIVPEAAVTLLVGVIGFAFSAHYLLRKPVSGPRRRARVGPGIFWGALTGFTSFVSHSGGPPFQVYAVPLRLEKAVFAGTTTIAFAIINALKLIPYYALGQLNMQSLEHAALLFIPAILAVFLSLRLVRWLPERAFYLVVIWLLLLVSAKLVHDGVTGLIWT